MARENFQPLKIAKTQCDQCLFSKNKIVSEERKKQIIKECLDTDDFFLCHKGTLAGMKVACAGFEVRYNPKTPRLARVLNFFEEVDPNNLVK